jgi:hypothetical protein
VTQQVTNDMIAAQAVGNAQMAAGAVAQLQSVTASVASNALTLTLNATNSLDFRNATLATGGVNSRSVPAAISVVVPASATLGTANGVQARLIMIALDNAGTVELAVVNLAGGLNLDETALISTTAISSSATAANVAYSTTARTSVPFRVVGSVDITEATAGTWATAPSAIQGAGGQALDSMASFGFGQSWQLVTRAASTTYTNTTGKPIMVRVVATSSGAGSVTTIPTVNGLTLNAEVNSAGGAGYLYSCSFMVPPGHTYSWTVGGTVGSYNSCYELR